MKFNSMIKRVEIIVVLLTMGAFLGTGCSTLDPNQNTDYSMMERQEVLVEEKKPTTGAWLGMLPGGGAFYGRQPGVGVIDLLLWPVSILWDPIVGFQTSKVVNYNATVAKLNKDKQRELNELSNENMLEQITKEEYVQRKNEIELKYTYVSF